jgi:hypothetical protein
MTQTAPGADSSVRAEGRISRALGVGDRLVVEEEFLKLSVDARHGRLELSTARHRLVARDVRATNLLGPWDGATGVVEWITVAAVAAGETCVEMRVRWATVPRHYRLVACSIEIERLESGASLS